jgi:hypothetical protein
METNGSFNYDSAKGLRHHQAPPVVQCTFFKYEKQVFKKRVHKMVGNQAKCRPETAA